MNPAEATEQSSASPKSQPLRILLLEDVALDAELMEAELRKVGLPFTILAVASEATFRTALREFVPDVILADFSLPSFDGLAALTIARESRCDAPFIFVSGSIGEENVAMLLQNGATDLVVKHNLARLGPAVQRALREAEERAKRRLAEKAMLELSARLLRLQDEERRRLARELHDSVAQNLSVLGLNISAAQRLVPKAESKTHSLLTDCAALAAETTRAVRTLSYLLHPPVLDTLGLAGALRDYVEGFSRRSGIEVELTVSDNFGRLRSDVETALFRIVQESLTNVHRHSGSARAKIALHRSEQEVALEIQDFGKGIPPEMLRGPGTAATLGVGIAGMRERLRQLQGRLEIEGAPGGTRLFAVVPLNVAP